MNINPRDKICNISIIKVRDFLKKYSNDEIWFKSTISYDLKISAKQSAEVIKELSKLGYIESAGRFKEKEVWKKTLMGSTFSLASAAKPVLRSTAQKHLSLLLKRVEEVNNEPKYLFKVSKVVLFGSYLTDAEKVSDIDIAIKTEWKAEHSKVKGNNKVEVSLKHAEKAENKGRHFSTYFDYLAWPEYEVRLYLKSKSRVISLHSINDSILEQTETKTIFEETIKEI